MTDGIRHSYWSNSNCASCRGHNRKCDRISCKTTLIVAGFHATFRCWDISETRCIKIPPFGGGGFGSRNIMYEQADPKELRSFMAIQSILYAVCTRCSSNLYGKRITFASLVGQCVLRRQKIPKVYGFQFILGQHLSLPCIFRSTHCLVHGAINHERTCGRIMHSCFAGRFAA
jgi:hypothetical protein